MRSCPTDKEFDCMIVEVLLHCGNKKARLRLPPVGKA